MNIGDFTSMFLHIDKYLISIIQAYGILVYPLLFLIIFVETGLVIMPFLPGDSLLFVAGTIAAVGQLNFFLLLVLLIIAAILGDSLNYAIGKYFGKQLSNHKWIKKESLEKTQEFYKKHGGKTIILARFVPFIRTFAPFVAGIGRMNYPKFLSYNIIGGVVWVTLFLTAGYFFGNISFIKDNITLVAIAIVIISLLPIIIQYIRGKSKR